MFNRLHTGSRAPALKRSVFGLLGILWLNMAVLPCAMAFQGDEDCAHCPPAEEHENHHSMAAHHDHEQAAAEPSCATMPVDCCDVVTANVDARGGKLDYKPAADAAIAAAPLASDGNCRQAATGQAAADPPDIAGSSPPLRVLYCVYLK